jgi:hypothetical protein
MNCSGVLLWKSSKSQVTWMLQKDFCTRTRQALIFNINNLVYLWSTLIMWKFKCFIAQQTVLHWSVEILCQNTVVPPYPLIQYPRFTAAWKKKLENWRNKWFKSSKTPAKWERAITWSNWAAQMWPVLDYSSFVLHTHTSPQKLLPFCF